LSEHPQSPVPLRVRLPYASEDEFIEKYGTNVARGGVFVATRSIKPEGTLLQFEFVLADGARLLRGEGVVVKAQVDEGGSRAGMTVRFTRLDARSKALVDRVVAFRSGEPAPEAPAPEAVTVAPDLVADAPSPAPSAAPAPSRRVSLPAAAPVPAAVDEVVLGIDLGTTNSRAAIMVDGKPRLVPLTPDGRTFSMPSVVARDEKDRFLVGVRARAQVLVDPANTVFGGKRLMGRRARSRQIRELTRRFPYAIVPDPEGDAGVELRGQVYSLPELAATLLGALKDAAQEHLGRPVRRAVLCVPAYFNDHQRSALLRAGTLAGLDVLRVFNEPSAVALAYGHGRGLARKRVLVYDLGGGTFDASVVEITGDDLEVVATGGDNFLGGLDFDDRVGDELLRVMAESQDTPPDGSPHSVQRIRDAAEQAKIALSEAQVTAVNVPFAATRPDGSPVDLRCDLSRDTLERLTADLVERTVACTEAVLTAASLTPQSLDEVLLVGGQSLAPLVRRRMEQALGRPGRADVDPHGAVALGAAILGDALVRAEKGQRGVTVAEQLSVPLGIALRGGGMRRVLDRRTRLPAEKTLALPVQAGVPLGLAVFQGESPQAEENEYLGALHLVPERSGEAKVLFRVATDGTVEVQAQVPGGRRAVTLASEDVAEDVRAALYASAPLPGDPEPPAPGGLLGGIRKLFGRR
jgi:molecular chaperone DnaK